MPMTDAPTEQKYDAVAGTYDQRWSIYVQPTLNYVNERLKLPHTGRLLDVSCGTGALLSRIRDRAPGLDLVGVDISSEMLQQARKKIGPDERVTLRKGNVEQLPFDDGVFDVVVSTSAFHYYRQPEQALSELRRVLRPGGQLAMMDWNANHWLWRILDPFLRRFDAAYRGCYAPEALHDLLHAADFEEVTVDPVNVGWIWGMWYASATRPS